MVPHVFDRAPGDASTSPQLSRRGGFVSCVESCTEKRMKGKTLNPADKKKGSCDLEARARATLLRYLLLPLSPQPNGRVFFCGIAPAKPL